jgi:hypothetical protein
MSSTNPPTHELDFEGRMQRRAERRASPEFKARLEAIKRRRRLQEIWREILADEDRRRLPHMAQIAVTPRVRGCRRAAEKAEF